jgi:hypothetical protein
MQKKFTVVGWETCTQPECDPAFVARLFLRSDDGMALTLFPVPGSTVKEDWTTADEASPRGWKGKTVYVSWPQAQPVLLDEPKPENPKPENPA